MHAIQYEMVSLEDIYYTTNNTQIGQASFRTLYDCTYTYIHVTTVYDKKIQKRAKKGILEGLEEREIM